MANRVQEITDVGGVMSWFPIDEKPADLPTRGTTVSQLSVRKIWLDGPYWLNGPETECSKQPKNDINVTMGMMAITDSPKPEYFEDIVDPQRTSKYLRTLRSVGWILRWRKYTKTTRTLLTLEELRDAKTAIVKQVHRTFFWEEFKALESDQPVHQQSSLMSLHPFVENGLIRIGGGGGGSAYSRLKQPLRNSIPSLLRSVVLSIS